MVSETTFWAVMVGSWGVFTLIIGGVVFFLTGTINRFETRLENLEHPNGGHE